jgi:hypothetical protein
LALREQLPGILGICALYRRLPRQYRSHWLHLYSHTQSRLTESYDTAIRKRTAPENSYLDRLAELPAALGGSCAQVWYS